MLGAMRQHSRSVLIYVLFGIIIAVFIINFGPGSDSSCAGVKTSFAAKVGGNTVSEGELQMILRITGAEPRMLGRVMDLLIQRELLAEEAERLGLSVSEADAENEIKHGRILIVGQPAGPPVGAFARFYKDGVLADYEKWKETLSFLRMTPKTFIDEQRRELLAQRMSQLIVGGTTVAPDEVKRDFIDKETQVKLEYVRFAARRYEEELELTPSDLEAFTTARKDEIKKQYEARAPFFKQVAKQARLHLIVVKSAKDASKEDVAKAEAKAKSAHARLKAGADFAKVAKEISEGETAKRGGALGWKAKGTTGLGSEADEKVFALQAGALTEVLRTEDGFAIAKVESFREGDLAYEAVERELAEEMLRKERATTAAKQAAEATMAKVKAGAKLDALFPKIDKDEGDQKPTGGDANAVKLQKTGLLSPQGNILPEIGRLKEGTQPVMSLKKGEHGGPYEVEGSSPTYVIVHIADRKEADLADFEKRKETLTEQAIQEKVGGGYRRGMIDTWVQKQCSDASKAGRIRVNQELFKTPEGEVMPYQPCAAGAMLF